MNDQSQQPQPLDSQSAPTGTRIDRWWRRLMASDRNRRIWYWGGPIAVTLLAAVLRFWNLAYPAVLMFDETYYVKDAYTLGQLGYEADWPDEPNPAFEAGQVDTYTDEPAFVVHPPLGKWLIYLGMVIFGADSPFGWRFSTALVGTIAVFVLTLVTRNLLKSTLLATIAGGLMAVSGLAISMSRTALLDNFLMLFVLLATFTLLRDRRHFCQVFGEHVREAKRTGASLTLGPLIWRRPWLITTGILLGAAASVKWSGLYFLVFFGLYVVCDDMLARRKKGIEMWYSGAVLKQGPVSFLLLVPVSVVTYLASWTGWLVTSGGWGRSWATEGDNAASGFFSWIPDSLQSLWNYHTVAYNFHVGLNAEHSWSANPLTWPLMIRPTLFYRRQSQAGQDGCVWESCVETLSSVDNPILWWSSFAAAIYLVYFLIRHRDWRAGFILLPLAAGFLPWLQYLNRTVFQFYTIVFLPYLILAVVFTLMVIMGKHSDPTPRRTNGLLVAGIYLFVVAAVSVFFYPLWTGMNVSYQFWQIHSWIPMTWR